MGEDDWPPYPDPLEVQLDPVEVRWPFPSSSLTTRTLMGRATPRIG